MLDHIGLSVSDFDAAKTFYSKALAPLGYELLVDVTPEMTGGTVAFCGFGEAPKPDFWFDNRNEPAPRLHVAFRASSRAVVDAFYRAAMAAGGRDNGGPGLRPEYHENYYGAFVLDADGHNIEAVCHTPE